jgi:hypothetical protein
MRLGFQVKRHEEMKNCYRPPSAVMIDKARKNKLAQPGPLWKATIIATATELFGTWLITEIGLIVYATYSASLGETELETVIRLHRVSLFSGVGLVFPVGRLSMSVVAGYVFSMIRRKNVFLTLILVSVLASLVSYVTRSMTTIYYYHEYTLALHVGLSLMCVPALFLGAFLSRENSR